jgi:SWI/SNF-related matrix-associated actin-dependent regulator of chromatin subfamily A3
MNLFFSIVFSFWKKSLDLVAYYFTARGIPLVRIDGSVSLAERRKVLSDFHAKQEIRVLLMTLGTGAVG